MKKLTQKLVLSVITMALVVVALGTSTFAWFTLTNSATVSQFEAQVTAGEGIEVSVGTWNGTAYVLDGESLWYTVMPSSVIQQYIVNEYGGTLVAPDFEFTDLTSPNGRDFGSFDLDSGVYTAGATSGFLEINLYFRSALEQDIVWSSATLSGNTIEDWDVNVDSFIPRSGVAAIGQDTITTTYDVAAWPAARVSITGNVGLTTPTLTTVAYQAPESLTSVYNSTADIASYDWDNSLNALEYVIGTNAYGAASYALAAGKNPVLSATPTAPVVAGTSVSSSVVSLDMDEYASQPGYAGGQVTMRVWIEGWDAEAYDAIFEAMLYVQVGFTTTTVTA